MKKINRRPNLILVLTDDQGYGDLGCHGNPIIKTPSIDRFYRESAHFSQFHVGTTCAPSRAGILTGMNCNSTGVWHTIGGASLLRQELKTLPEIMGENGYRTGLFGKWHLGDDYPFRPQDRGFEETVYHRGGGITQVSDHWGNNYFDDTYLVNGEPRKFNGYCTDVFFGEAEKFIRTHRNEPFCCFITPNAPHHPHNVEKHYRDLYASDSIPEARRRFYGMISNIDDNFERLTRLLKELDLEDDTILMFMTDNGSACGCVQDDKQFCAEGYNAGMRGLKSSPYEGGHRVPFFLRYPAAGFNKALDVDRLTSYIDFMPSMLDLCGIDSPEVEGQSLVPLLNQKENGIDWDERTLVTDTQRIPHPIKWRLSCVMKGSWRLICGRELYDLSSDPEQRVDVSAKHPDVVEGLREGYESWWIACSRQFNEISFVRIGSDICPKVDLTTQEMRNDDSDVVWHQGQVRAAQVSLGWWELFAEKAGLYSVTLRRWPEECGRGVSEGIVGFDVDIGPEDFLDASALDFYRNGEAVEVYGACIKIDDQSHYRDIGKDESAVTFLVEIDTGPHVLRAWFSGGTNSATAAVLSPYYVSLALQDSLGNDR